MKSLSLISHSYLINIDHLLSARINKYTQDAKGALVRTECNGKCLFLHYRCYTLSIGAHFVIIEASLHDEKPAESILTEEI